jgi:hypothetical protein
VTPLSDKELLQNVILAAKNALLHSDDFKDNFVSITDGQSSTSVLSGVADPEQNPVGKVGSWSVKKLSESATLLNIFIKVNKVSFLSVVQ